MNSSLNKYIPLVEFIGEACGADFEVILHDTENPERSIIAIKNGHLSGREIGGPMTELALRLARKEEYRDRDFIAGYEGRLQNGKRFISSTFFIKEQEKLIGMLCINFDPSAISALSGQVQKLLDSFHIISGSRENKSDYTEVLDNSVSMLSRSIIDETISSLAVQPDRLTASEKQDVIAELNEQDVFATKGAVAQTARRLNISVPTVYRYLKKIRDEQR